jgi:hypothetical protein
LYKDKHDYSQFGSGREGDLAKLNPGNIGEHE